MKNKSLIIVFIMLAGAFSAIGQSHLWKYPTCPTDTSIVRKWKDEMYLVYFRFGLVREVVLHDIATSMTYSVPIPSVININDFRIAGDSVFAGGYIQDVSGKRGILACFDINDMINGSGTFKWMKFDNSSLQYTCCDIADRGVLITEVKRISLFKDGHLTRIAFIANNHIVNYPNHNIVYMKHIGYGDAAFTGDPITPWELNQYHYNKDGVEEYTDIACTDNRIVVTAKDKEEDWFHFMVFNRTANFANYCLLSPPIYYFTDHTVAEQVMVTECGGDKVAVTYNFREPANRGIAVKLLDVGSSAPVLLNSLDIPTTAVGMMKDTRYSPAGPRLWFLTEANSPFTNIWNYYIFSLDVNNIYAGFYAAKSITDCKFHSLDNFRDNGFVASGMNNGVLNVYDLFDWSEPDNCGNTEMIPGPPCSPTFRSFGRHHCIVTPKYRFYSNYFTTSGEETENICITKD